MRYALYWTAQPHSALADFARYWFGWQADRGLCYSIGHKHAALVKNCARYGLHVTLKAPFQLKSETPYSDLQTGVKDFVARQVAPPETRWQLTWLGDFLALCPDDAEGAHHEFTNQLMLHLESFRAPLTEAELKRRRSEQLSTRQRAALMRYGYPFVLSDLRLHMTLSGPVDPLKRDEVEKTVTALLPWQELNNLAWQALSIVAEDPEQGFRVKDRVEFQAR